MRWMLNLDGGPKRVNHAAVVIGDKIYSFGGYSATEVEENDFIDVHILNTFTYRWKRLPVHPLPDDGITNASEKRKWCRRSATISGDGCPSTSGQQSSSSASPSSSSPFHNHPPLAGRRRARSMSDLLVHPLAQIRAANPPLDIDDHNNDEDDFGVDGQARGLGRHLHHQLQQHNYQRRRQPNQQSPSGGQLALHSPANSIPEEDEEEMGSGEEEEESQLDGHRPQMHISQYLQNRLDSLTEDSDDENADEEGEEGQDGTISTDSTQNASSEDEEENESMDGNGEEEMEGMEDMDDFRRLLRLDRDDGQEEEQDGLPAGRDFAQLAKMQEYPEIPYKRYGHTVVVYKGQAYLWGGRNDTFGCRKTLHRYDPVANKWSIVPTEGECPPERDGHTAVVDGEHMYIFGGYEEREQRFSQETYSFHFPTNTWAKLKVKGQPAQYRDFHAACILDGKMYVFGGRSDEHGQSHTSNDLYDDKFHCLDLRAMEWRLVEVKNGNVRPSGRRSLTMWTYGEAIYMFGGYDSNQNVHFSDLWRFDPHSGCWAELKPSGQGPSPRRRQCTLMAGTRLFLFGGTRPNPRKKAISLEDLGDLFVLDFSPTLAGLCMQTLLKSGLHRKGGHDVLPKMLLRELHHMSTPNRISKTAMRCNFENVTRG